MTEQSIKKKTPQKNRSKKGWLIHCLAILSLIIAYGLGSFNSQNDIEDKISAQLPEKTIKKISSSPDVFAVFNKATRQNPNHQKQGWLVVTEQQGWGGPMDVGAWINTNGSLEKLIVLDHRETPVFFEILKNQKYFDQYIQKNIQDPFELHQDIDGISGATISSQAIAKAAQRSAHYWGRTHFQLDIQKTPIHWQIGANEFILIVLYAVILISAVKKYRKMRTITLAFSIVFLGFYLSTPISISAFGALLMGYVPSITGQLFW